MVTAHISGYGAAFPDAVTQDELWHGYFAGYFGHSRGARRIFDSTQVRRRHAAVNPLAEDISPRGTSARMQRYVAEAVPLGQQAVTAALDDAGIAADEVGLLAVASCTGYATPGVDIRIAERLGMSSETQRLMIGHMGCYAALPGLATVADYVVSHGRAGVLLCVELPSLHVQPQATGAPDMEQVVAHALFGDAAAAVVLQPGDVRPEALRVVDTAAVTDPATAHEMTWEITDHGFRMGLSPRVPEALAKHLQPMIEGLLDRHGLDTRDVAAWAIHPGGPRILDITTDTLGLPATALTASRAVLAERGNCSSATLLLVLRALRQAGRPGPGGSLVAAAFGPGLTLYASLLHLS